MNDQTTRIEDAAFLESVASARSRTDLWKTVLQAAKVKTIAEIGVWRGDFAKDILKSCDSIERYYMVDPWAKLSDWNKPFNVDTSAFEHVYIEAMSKTEFARDKLTVLRGRTKDVIDQIPDESIDFAYVDGDHTLRGITIDLIKLLPKIKENGLIGGDDFTDNPWQHDVRFEPTLVCPYAIYFAEAMDLPIVALPFGQFLIQKRREARFQFVDTTGKYSKLSLNKLAPRFALIAAGKKLKSILTNIGRAKNQV